MKRYITLFLLNLLTLNLYALDPSIDSRNINPADILNDANSEIDGNYVSKHTTFNYDDTEILITQRADKNEPNSLLISFRSDDDRVLYKLYQEYLSEYLNNSVVFVCYDSHCKDGIDVFYRIYQIDKPIYTICTTIDYNLGFFIFGIISNNSEHKFNYDDIENLERMEFPDDAWPLDLKVAFVDDSLIETDLLEEIPTNVIFYRGIKTEKTANLSFNDLKVVEKVNNKNLLKKVLFIENENLTGIKISCTDKLKKNPEFLTQKVKINDNQIYTMYDLLQNPKCKFDICNKITFSFSVSDEVIKEMKKDFSIEVY